MSSFKRIIIEPTGGENPPLEYYLDVDFGNLGFSKNVFKDQLIRELVNILDGLKE